jgi:hypothetical protein
VSLDIRDAAVLHAERSGHDTYPFADHAMVVENRPVHEVATTYGVSTSWLYELLARYRRE